MAELGMTPHPTGSHVRLSPSPKGEGRKTTRLRVASNRRADWQVVLCARGARASSQGLCPPRLWRHEPQAKHNEEPPAKLVGSFLVEVTGLVRNGIAIVRRRRDCVSHDLLVPSSEQALLPRRARRFRRTFAAAPPLPQKMLRLFSGTP